MNNNYFDRTHAHAGINSDGSTQIEYASIANVSIDYDDIYNPPTIPTTATETFTRVEAVPSSLQTFNAGAWTKALFATENTDALNEYTPATSIFVPAENGTYTFEVLISIPNGAGGNSRRIVAVAVNGTYSPVNFAGFTASGAPTDYIHVRITLDCVTTSYYEIYFVQQSGVNLTQVASSNRLQIFRQITSVGATLS